MAGLDDYRILQGSGSTWAEESAAGLTFTVNGALSKFTGIEVDGKAVDAGSYTVQSGSTIITLKTAYLQTLSAGTHTLTVLYTDGEASGTFAIAEQTSSSTEGDPGILPPQTGDPGPLSLWITILLASGAALTCTALYGRKQKHGISIIWKKFL